MSYIKSDVFIDVATQCDFDPNLIREELQKLNPSYAASNYTINSRISNYRRKGLLPLDSGNFVSLGEVLKGSSTLFDSNGSIKQQWIKTDVPKQQFLDSFKEAIAGIAQSTPVLPTAAPISIPLNDDLTTLYISNDCHLGALMWDKEVGQDWNIDIAKDEFYKAYDHLIEASPASKYGIVCDLGDLTEADDNRNMTPKSGHILATDSRHGKVLRVAYEMLIYAINKALTKHEIVYFYNIAGNHDMETSTAVREVIRVAFQNNPRVIVDETAFPIKYHQHDEVLLQFAHGDGMKMNKAGEVMAVDKQDIFSSTKFRFSHFGHTHVDKVHDGAICRAESHRNIPPNNHWAYAHGYRRSPGTMKSITYHKNKGEISRQIYTI